MPKKEKTPIAEDQLKLTNRIGERIVEALKTIDEAYAVEGLHKRSVYKQKDPRPGYRMKPLAHGSEHFITDFYVGARGQLIFKAYPVDTQEYDWADVDEKTMDEVFPLVGASLAQELKIDGCEDFTEIVTTVKKRLILQDEEEALAEAAAKQDANKTYQENPNFGRF